MKRVMLVDPGKVSEAWYSIREMPTLSLGYIGTYLESMGHKVKIIDMATYKIDNEQLKNEILQFQPDIVGITSSTFNINSAYEAACAVKETDKDIFTVIGGAHATALPQLTLEECPALDAVVVGEGEIAMEKICHNTKKGIIYEPYIKNLDILPIVDWTLFDLSQYKKLYSFRFDQELYKIPISIVRGCPYQCKFCFKLFTGAARSRSANSVMTEIKHNYDKLGLRMFYVADSTLLLFKENINHLCQMIIDSGIKISLIIQTRVETVDEKSVDLLKRAGCETFFMGVESGNNEILKKCGKNITKDLVRKAVKIVHAAGISRIRCSFIVGLEGDTRDTIQETIDFSRELKQEYGLNRASFHCLDIYPETEYWKMIKRGEGNLKFQIEPYDWASYSRLFPMTLCGDISLDELRAFRELGKSYFEDET